MLSIERCDGNLSESFFRAINIKSKDRHFKVWREIPTSVYEDFEYFINKYPQSPYPFKIYQPNSYTCMTKKLLREYGFPEDLYLHSCRHTAITRALDTGMPMREVNRIIDHSSMAVTESYAHDEVRKALDIGLE